MLGYAAMVHVGETRKLPTQGASFGNPNIIGRSGSLTLAKAVKGRKMFARDVLPLLEQAKAVRSVESPL
jgi:hypothetical protein